MKYKKSILPTCPMMTPTNQVFRLELDFLTFFVVTCGLATTCREEGRLPRLELVIGFHFFIKINILEDECYNSCTYFDLFYPGPTCFKQEERCAKIAKMIRIV